MRFSRRYHAHPESTTEQEAQEAAYVPELDESERLIAEELVVEGIRCFSGDTAGFVVDPEYADVLRHRWNQIADKPNSLSIDRMKLLAITLPPRETLLAVPLLGVYMDWEQNYLLRRTHQTTDSEYHEWLEYYLSVSGDKYSQGRLAASAEAHGMLTTDADVRLLPNVKTLVAQRIKAQLAKKGRSFLSSFDGIADPNTIIERASTRVDVDLKPEVHVLSWNSTDLSDKPLPALPGTRQYLQERGLLHDPVLEWAAAQLLKRQEKP
jgi:hypothetical protein